MPHAIFAGLDMVMNSQTKIATDDELPLRTRTLALESARALLEVAEMVRIKLNAERKI